MKKDKRLAEAKKNLLKALEDLKNDPLDIWSDDADPNGESDVPEMRDES